MRTDFRRALGFGVVALVVSAALVTPLAQAGGFERSGMSAVLGRFVGLGLMGVAMLLVVETPALFVCGWLIRGRLVFSRVAWALVAGVLAMAPIVAMNLPGEPVWMKISETFDAVLSRPAIFVTDWLPFVVSGSVFGWYFFIPQRGNVAAAG